MEEKLCTSRGEGQTFVWVFVWHKRVGEYKKEAYWDDFGKLLHLWDVNIQKKIFSLKIAASLIMSPVLTMCFSSFCPRLSFLPDVVWAAGGCIISLDVMICLTFWTAPLLQTQRPATSTEVWVWLQSKRDRRGKYSRDDEIVRLTGRRSFVWKHEKN